MIRAFLGLPVSQDTADHLTVLQHRLGLPRPVPARNFHITLAFLGQQREDTLEELHLALLERPLEAPDLRLDGLGVFGGETPRAIHATLAPDPRLSALARRARQAARHAGIALEARKFVPHVTLGRFAPGEVSAQTLAGAIGRIGGLSADPWVPAALVLFRSTLRKDGAEYDALAEYPLRA